MDLSNYLGASLLTIEKAIPFFLKSRRGLFIKQAEEEGRKESRAMERHNRLYTIQEGVAVFW